MIKYTKDLWRKIKEASIKTKVFLSILLVLYIGIILICTISFKFNYTSPGTLNRINSVIEIEDKEITNNFYTVSVYTETKSCTILEYLLRKIDPKQDIVTKETYESTTIFTYNEEVKAGEAQKEQSIQDSIIVAYDIAKEDGFPVDLVKEYAGVMVCYMPMNLMGTGPESIQSKDVVTKIGDTEIDSMDTLINIVNEIYTNNLYKDPEYQKPIVEVLRKGSDGKFNKLVLDNCNPYCLGYLGKWYEVSVNYANTNNLPSYRDYLNNFMFDYYTLDIEKSTPKISVNNAASIGPSGGLCQTLYVYNALTDNSLIKENELITATGTIANDGMVGAIGAVDKKVYTVDIYMSKYFFVPELNYEEAMQAYNSIKNPNFEVVKVNNARDAIHFLKEAGE